MAGQKGVNLRCRCSVDDKTPCVGKCGYICANLPPEFAEQLTGLTRKAWLDANKMEPVAIGALYPLPNLD